MRKFKLTNEQIEFLKEMYPDNELVQQVLNSGENGVFEIDVDTKIDFMDYIEDESVYWMDNLSDGTSYDLIYACYGVKNGELKSEAGGFKYFTSADIGSYWNNLNTELEAIPINESELP